MTELNKTVKTLSQKEQQESYDRGYNRGFIEGEAKGQVSGFNAGISFAHLQAWEDGYLEGSFRWKFVCKKCGKNTTLTTHYWNKLTKNPNGLLEHEDCAKEGVYEYIVQGFVSPAMSKASGPKYAE